MKKILCILLLISTAWGLFSCEKPFDSKGVYATDLTGIVQDVDCSRAAFFEFETISDRYLEISFIIKINDESYKQKSLTVIATDKDGAEVYSGEYTVNDNGEIQISYREYHPLSLGSLKERGAKTKKLSIYFDDSLIGSANVSSIIYIVGM